MLIMQSMGVIKWICGGLEVASMVLPGLAIHLAAVVYQLTET